MAIDKIHLKVMVPEQILVDQKVDKVIAEAQNGFFCLEPRHIDFTSVLRPGILYSYEADAEHVIAVDEGVLVKCGEEVLVSVISAITGENLETLEQEVREKFINRKKTEQAAQIALQNMEADLIRRFIELEKGVETNI